MPRTGNTLIINLMLLYTSIILSLSAAKSSAQPSKTSLSLGYYQLRDRPEASDTFYTLGLKHQHQQWRFSLSQPYVNSSQYRSGLANGTLAAKYKWDLGSLEIELGAKRRLGNANKDVTLPVEDTGVFTSISTMWMKTYLYLDVGYWRREETELNRKNAAQWAMGGFYPVYKGQWLGLEFDQSQSAIEQNIDRYFSVYWQVKVNARYSISTAVSKGLTKESPDFFAGLQVTRRF